MPLKGIETVRSNLKNVQTTLVEYAFNLALSDLGNKIQEISEPHVPVDKGLLKSSFTVEKINGKWVCGYNEEYAMYIHQGIREDGTREIQNRPGGGKSFFLSQPVQDNKTQLLEFLQERFDFYISQTKLKK